MLVAGDEEGLDPKDDDMFEPSTYKVFFKTPTEYTYLYIFTTLNKLLFKILPDMKIGPPRFLLKQRSWEWTGLFMLERWTFQIYWENLFTKWQSNWIRTYISSNNVPCTTFANCLIFTHLHILMSSSNWLQVGPAKCVEQALDRLYAQVCITKIAKYRQLVRYYYSKWGEMLYVTVSWCYSS